MSGGSSDDDSTDVEPAWHERPSTLAGASIGALIVLAILFWGVSCVQQEFNSPEPASQYYLDPSTSDRSSSTSGGTTTTQTITSTSPPMTTDINPGDPTSTSPTTPTSSTSTTTSFNPDYLPRTRRPTSSEDDDATSTRQRPRLNQTRTVYPEP